MFLIQIQFDKLTGLRALSLDGINTFSLKLLFNLLERVWFGYGLSEALQTDTAKAGLLGGRHYCKWKKVCSFAQLIHVFEFYQVCTIYNTVDEEHTILLYWRDRTMVVHEKMRDVPDIYRFPTVHMVKTHFLLEILGTSEPSLGILEKFQWSLALLNIKYNCVCRGITRIHWSPSRLRPSVRPTAILINIHEHLIKGLIKASRQTVN